MKNTVLTIAVLLITNLTISVYGQCAPKETEVLLTTINKRASHISAVSPDNSSTQLISVSRDQKGEVVSVFALSENNKETEDVYGRSYTQIYKDILFAENMAKSAKEINAKYTNIIKDESGNIISFEYNDKNSNHQVVNISLDNHGNILNIYSPNKKMEKSYQTMYQELLSADMMMQVANELNAINGKVYRDDEGRIFAFEVKSKSKSKTKSTEKRSEKEGIIL